MNFMSYIEFDICISLLGRFAVRQMKENAHPTNARFSRELLLMILDRLETPRLTGGYMRGARRRQAKNSFFQSSAE